MAFGNILELEAHGNLLTFQNHVVVLFDFTVLFC